MKTKQHYIHPEIELIHLDNDISLQLESATPDYEPIDGDWARVPGFFNNDPCRNSRPK